MKLEQLIRKSVKPYGGLPLALSGGIDSSLLAAIMKPKFAISVRLPDDERFNEIQYSEMVCKHLGIKHIIIDLDENTFDDDVKTAVKAIGRPIPHFNIFPLFQNLSGRIEKIVQSLLVVNPAYRESNFCAF